jgi:dipeptidyl aminopeptidase/acylaminoacyl peptidase
MGQRGTSFGTWHSPLSAERVATGGRRLSTIALDGDDIYWLEGRPDEGGRNVLVRAASGTVEDVTPAGTNVRTRVHEYGGAPYLVHRGITYYVEFSDQRIYRLERGALSEGGPPEGRPPESGPSLPITPAGNWCYADFVMDAARDRLIAVREDRTLGGKEPVNSLVAIPLTAPHDVTVIASGHDFYSTPRLSPDGARLCWLTWDHPRMPWDGTELWVVDLTVDGSMAEPRRVAGGPAESIFQPGWMPDGTLLFVSDRTGWWNFYRWKNGPEAVLPFDADFGRPQWQFGMNTWAPIDGTRIVASYQERGIWRLSTIDLERGVFAPLPTALEPGDHVAATATDAIFVGGSPSTADAVVRVDLASGRVAIVRAASDDVPDGGLLSSPEAIEFPTDGGLTAHAFYYAPRNPDVEAPAGERPPLIVISHGGPTASTSTRLNLEIQYWTSRGFGVVDVNYGGSSGYGRAYRQRLNLQWGVVDVADCVNAARHLANNGRVDASKLVIRGRSAGGYTTLAALTFHPGVFKAGASHYGVSDLEAMVADTHKFESRYLDTLIGPYPQAREVYRARSPIHFADRVACPVIFFHGAEDLVVPLNQCEMMAKTMTDKGLRVEVLVFPGEQHGFRKKETLIRCLEAELAFYLNVVVAPASAAVP